ncbi:hypothetical protein CPC16_011711 [Podila verticillata]|nr:hypothetical protein CPC16_011711 [Podila verticillata]
MATTETVSSLQPDPSSFTPIRNVGPYKITKDICLTPFSASDAAELHRVLNINNAVSLGLYTASVTFPFPLEEAQNFISRQVAKRTERGFVDCWAIRSGEEGSVIGLLSLHAFGHETDGAPACYHASPLSDELDGEGDSKKPLRCGVLGYWLSPEFTGRGIMTRVVEYGLRHLARSAMGYERVHGKAWEDNVASCRVMERAGMMRAASVARFVPKFGEIKSSAHYILDTLHQTPPDHSSSPIHNTGPYNVADDLYLSFVIPLDTPEIYRILNISDAISKGLYSAKMTFPFTREGSDALTQYHVAQRSTHGFVDCWAIRPAPEGPVLGLLGLHAYNHEAEGVPVCYHTSDVGLDWWITMRCGRLGYWLSPEVTG